MTRWHNTSRFSPAVPETVHDGHEVAIIRPLTADEADLPDTGLMYQVRCAVDGTTFHSFADELDPVPPEALQYQAEQERQS